MKRILLTTFCFNALALGACDSNPACDGLAKHITEVLANEKGETIPQEAIDKATKDMLDSCNKGAPDQAVIDCAMKANTREALTACDELAKSE